MSLTGSPPRTVRSTSAGHAPAAPPVRVPTVLLLLASLSHALSDEPKLAGRSATGSDLQAGSCMLLHMSIRMSLAKVKILGALLETPSEPHYGYELMRATGVKSGSLYPILEQLEKAGWLEARWEDTNTHREGRPPRRWYRLTGLGEGLAPPAISEHLAGVRLPGLAAPTVGRFA